MDKSYYAIIPAEVRYCERLTPNAKLLYGEITALCNQKGHCWAKNKYFSELYKVSETSISKWVSQLEENGFIKTWTNHNGKREIKIITLEEKLKPLRKVKGGVEEKFKPYIYNIYNNNTLNNNAESPKIKKFNDFHPLIQKGFFAIIKLFPKTTQPKTVEMKRKWVQELEDLWRLDDYHPRKVYAICSKVRNDEFWSTNFLTILKLRRRNKDKIKYIELFENKFGQHLKGVKFEKFVNV